MSPAHFHLRTAASEPSARWRDAFPDGEILDQHALAQRLAAHPAEPCVVWLSAQDRQWPQQVERLRGSSPCVRVVLLSAQPEEREGIRAFRAGVSGYAHSHAVPVLLRDVGQAVEHGGLWLGPALMQRLLAGAPEPPAPAPAVPLSPREAEVAAAVAAGRSNKEVARMMGITERTVKAHLGVAFEKLGVRGRVQLALLLGASVDAQPPVDRRGDPGIGLPSNGARDEPALMS